MSAREPRFERLHVIGTGASSTVELARLTEPFGDLPAGHEVALKTLKPDLDAIENAEAEFAAEAEASAVARDLSLVRVLHQGSIDGRPYLLLQYVPGRSLRDALDEGPLPEPLVRSVGAQLAGALAALHEAGLAHGDVKPENARIDENGRAVLLDLGFARRFHDSDSRPERGSLAYLSPERARGGPPTAASDVFALGVVLYELATGIHPFGHSSGKAARAPGVVLGLGSTSGALIRRSIEVPGADELLAAIGTGRIVTPSHLDLSLSPFIDLLLLETLARAPELRPSARELATRLTETESGDWWRKRVDFQGRGREAPPAARFGKHLSPLVGRVKELEELGSTLERVRDGKTAVAWVSGPEGSGKWRLVSEFAARARTSDDPPIYLYARWSERAEALPAGALLVLLYRWLRLPLGAEPGENEARRLTELVGPRAAETLLAALAPSGATPKVHDFVPAAIAAWLMALGKSRPVLVFLDDVHRSGPITLEAISRVLDGIGSSPVFMILGVRDDVEAQEPGLERLDARVGRLAELGDPFLVVRMSLGPLDRAAVRQLVDHLFARSVPRGRLAEVLWLRSRGNPALVTEILYDLIASGGAQPASGDDLSQLVLTIGPDELPLPRSLNRIVAERFGSLEPEDRRWLERLSVVGGRIAPDFLVRAFPPTGRAEIDATLARLVRLQWLVPVANRYRFARPALREGLYRSLTPGRRKRLHLSAAAGLESEAGSARTATVEEEFQRAFHLRAAEEPAELLALVLSLVRVGRRRVSARRLLTLARWGLDALAELDSGDVDQNRVQLELLETATDAADRLGRRDEQRELLDLMIEMELDTSASPSDAARLYLLHGRYAAGTGRFGLARGMFRNAVQLADASEDPSLSSEAARRLAQVQSQIGEFEEARVFAKKALGHAVGTNQRALAHLALTHLDVLENRLEDSLQRVERTIKSLRARDDVRLGVAAYANMLRARIWRGLGRPGRALGSARRAVMLALRAGERRLEAEGRARLGGLLLDIDRPDDGEAELRHAILLADEIEDKRSEVLAKTLLGLLLWEEDGRDASQMIERAAGVAAEIGFYRAESFGLALLARIFATEDDLERADEVSALSVELVERHGAEIFDQIVVVGTRVLVLRELGREDEAEALLNLLSRRVRRGNKRIRDRQHRHDQREYMVRLLDAVLSSDGPVFARVEPE